jgi:hypothetical protein
MPMLRIKSLARLWTASVFHWLMIVYRSIALCRDSSEVCKALCVFCLANFTNILHDLMYFARISAAQAIF